MHIVSDEHRQTRVELGVDEGVTITLIIHISMEEVQFTHKELSPVFDYILINMKALKRLTVCVTYQHAKQVNETDNYVSVIMHLK